jgi:Domain of unknown function (DUF4136)
MSPLRRRQLLALSFAGMLAACASTPPEATVQVFTSQPQLPAGSTYRFERLPSQANQPGQIALEAAADGVLARAGLRRDDAAPRLSVQLTGSQDAWAGGPAWGAPSVGIGIGGGSWGSSVGVGLGFPIGGGGNRAAQRVDVLVRDLTNGQVVFQSQASGGSGASAASLLDAAMRGFPNAPPGTRQVPLAAATPR